MELVVTVLLLLLMWTGLRIMIWFFSVTYSYWVTQVSMKGKRHNEDDLFQYELAYCLGIDKTFYLIRKVTFLIIVALVEALSVAGALKTDLEDMKNIFVDVFLS